LAKNVALALTSDLFDVLFPLFHGTKSDFLNFMGEATSPLKDKTAKFAESSEMTVQSNSLRGHDPYKQSAFSNFLEEQVAFSHFTHK
jgi:hypothetical protein